MDENALPDSKVTRTWVGTQGGVADGVQIPPRWRLDRQIGSGGQADVWLALDTELDEWVAIKVFKPSLDEAARERIRREVRIGRTIHHRNILRVHEFIQVDGRFAAVLEWAPGGSLANKVASDGPLPISDVKDIADQVLSGLGHLHELGLVHRDVKPSNILAGPNGSVLLSDFGLTRRLEGDPSLTRTGKVVGTPRYLSPEAIAGQPLGPPSDLYALGITLFELLTGNPAFEGSTDFETADAHLRARTPDPRRHRPDCPKHLARFVMRLMEKDPRDRWPDAAAALADFRSRHHVRIPSTVRRRVAYVSAAAAILVPGYLLSVGRFAQPVPAAAQVAEDRIIALDESGRELWTTPTRGDQVRTVVADLVGDHRPEVAALHRLTDDDGTSRFLLDILSSEGDLDRSVSLSTDTVGQRFPDFERTYEPRFLTTADIDGNGRDDLVWSESHHPFFPAAVHVWSPAGATPPGTLLTHAGHISNVVGHDLDHDGDHELVAAGYNNVLGYQSVVAILDPRVDPFSGTYLTTTSPADVAMWKQVSLRKTRVTVSYTPIGRELRNLREISFTDNDIVISSRTRELVLDASGNPSTSPLYGRGPEARTRAWDELVDACADLQRGDPYDPGWMRRFESTHRDVLTEPPMQLAVRTLLARSLAIGGSTDDAARVLRELPDELGGDSARIQEAEYLTIGGHVDAGLHLLRQVVQTADLGPERAAAARDMALIAGITAEPEVFSAAIQRGADPVFDRNEPYWRDLDALYSFLAREFSDESLDLSNTVNVLPEVTLARLWASLERGDSVDAVLAEARNHAQRTEVREVARCLEAYCHLLRGEPPIARALLDRTIPLLENRARRDLRFAVWMPVAQWLYGQVDTASPAPTIRTRPPDTVVNFDLAAWDSATPFRAREPRVAAMTASESQVGPGPTEGTR